jgi:hypothetical protein
LNDRARPAVGDCLRPNLISGDLVKNPGRPATKKLTFFVRDNSPRKTLKNICKIRALFPGEYQNAVTDRRAAPIPFASQAFAAILLPCSPV